MPTTKSLEGYSPYMLANLKHFSHLVLLERKQNLVILIWLLMYKSYSQTVKLILKILKNGVLIPKHGKNKLKNLQRERVPQLYPNLDGRLSFNCLLLILTKTPTCSMLTQRKLGPERCSLCFLNLMNRERFRLLRMNRERIRLLVFKSIGWSETSIGLLSLISPMHLRTTNPY